MNLIFKNLFFAFFAVLILNFFSFDINSYIILIFILLISFIKERLFIFLFLVTLYIITVRFIFHSFFLDVVHIENYYIIIIDTIFISLLYYSTTFEINLKIYLKRILITSIFIIFLGKFTQYVDNFKFFLSFLSISFNILDINSNINRNKISFLKKSTIITATFIISFFSFSYYNFSPSNVGIIDSRWCSTRGEFTDDYTISSAYSYSEMKRIISSSYHTKVIDPLSLNYNNIINHDVLIFITPTYYLNENSINSVLEFVKKGKRIILIGDHTNLYGHATVLNKLCERLNISFREDSLFSITSDKVYSVLPYNIKKFDIKTPCSISIRNIGYIWGLLKDSIKENADYTRANFFGELRWTTDDTRDDWVVGATIPYGKGEVILFSDSTIFSNFSIYQPYYIELLEYMISHNKFLCRIPIVLILLIFTCIFINLFTKNRSYLFFGSLSALTIILFSLCINISEKLYNNIDTIDIYSDIFFIKEHVDSRHVNNDNLSTLYSYIARSGVSPRYISDVVPVKIYKKSLIILQAKNIGMLNKITHGREFVRAILLGKSDQLLQLGYGESYFLNDMDKSLRLFFNVNNLGFFYSCNNNYNTYFKCIPVLATHSILDDGSLNHWWVNNDISPFKRHVLNAFFAWMTRDSNIPVFMYPEPDIKINLNCINEASLFKDSEGNTININHCPLERKKFIYLGSRKWGIQSEDDGKFFLIGGPELDDTCYKSDHNNISWAALYGSD